MNPPTKSNGFAWPTDDDPVTIVHGDCLTFLRKVPDDYIDAVVTDPPYGISFSSSYNTREEKLPVIANDERPFVWWLYDAARVMKEGAPLVCFCRWDVQEAFRLAIGWAGLNVISQLVWNRGIHGMGDLTGAPGPQHDVMWLASKGKYKLPGGRPTTIYTHKRVDGDKQVHPTEKPVPLMEHLIKDYTRPGDLILEPFGGSGSTGVAAWNTGRKCIMTELSDTFVAVQRKRLEKLWGTTVLVAMPKGRSPQTQEPLV